ncbi:hypothetical protein [Arthrobacter sp.]|uniref:hypothetical protein n=1 Tax=Arthrobacter sp. TaxID=1667 RepID=UPI00339277C4
MTPRPRVPVVAGPGRNRIFAVSNLAELDRGRSLILASGARPTLISTLAFSSSQRGR